MSDTQSPSTTAEHPPEEVRLAITGMTCASCSARIERKLAKVAGVESATVNLATEKAQVSLQRARDGRADRRRGEEDRLRRQRHRRARPTPATPEP